MLEPRGIASANPRRASVSALTCFPPPPPQGGAPHPHPRAAAIQFPPGKGLWGGGGQLRRPASNSIHSRRVGGLVALPQCPPAPCAPGSRALDKRFPFSVLVSQARGRRYCHWPGEGGRQPAGPRHRRLKSPGADSAWVSLGAPPLGPELWCGESRPLRQATRPPQHSGFSRFCPPQINATVAIRQRRNKMGSSRQLRGAQQIPAEPGIGHGSWQAVSGVPSAPADRVSCLGYMSPGPESSCN